MSPQPFAGRLALTRCIKPFIPRWGELISYKWEALISFLGEKERKNASERKKQKKKIRAFARPSLELSPFMLSQLSNTVHQRIELT